MKSIVIVKSIMVVIVRSIMIGKWISLKSALIETSKLEKVEFWRP